MQDGRAAVQKMIEHLLDSLAFRDIGLVVLRDFEAFEAASSRFSIRRRFPPVRTQARGGANEFWLRLEDSTGRGIATVSASVVQSDDVFEDIRTGTLWHEGGFAASCGLAGIICRPPSRLVDGKLSIIGIDFAGGAGMPEELVWDISRLSQALAFKHQDSDFAVMVPDAAIDAANLAVLESTFQRCDPCIDGLMPFADRDVELPLLHTSRGEFMDWAMEIIATERQSTTIDSPVDVREPV